MGRGVGKRLRLRRRLLFGAFDTVFIAAFRCLPDGSVISLRPNLLLPPIQDPFTRGFLKFEELEQRLCRIGPIIDPVDLFDILLEELVVDIALI